MHGPGRNPDRGSACRQSWNASELTAQPRVAGNRRSRWIVIMVAGVLPGCVMAGPAEASSAPACGDTIVANTTLHADVLNCEATGLVIGADGITLDLNGRTVSGNGSSPPERPFDPGVLVGAHYGVRVIGPGTVRGFDGSNSYGSETINQLGQVV